MFLTVPSELDYLSPTTEQYEDTQVEVSVDRKAYSILVLSEESNVQSVVAVPKMASPPRRSFAGAFSRKKKEARAPILPPAARTATSNRKADTMRDSSPIRRNRSSAMDRRRDTQSLPPPRSRVEPYTLKRTDTPAIIELSPTPTVRRVTERGAEDRRRDASCPPRLQLKVAEPNTTKTVSNRRGEVRAGGKPNLVSKTASKKSQILRSMRGLTKKTKVVPSVI